MTGRPVKRDKVALAKRLRTEQTPEEKLLWQQLRGNRLRGLHFRRQQVIEGYVTDFYCHAAKLVVEVDGPVHGTRREQDAYRDSVLRGVGLTVMRVSNEQVRDEIE